MANDNRDPKTGRFRAKSGKARPKTTPILHDVSEGFSAVVRTAKDVLINPDIAWRTDRQLQEQMIRDPMVMAPLQKRMLATALLDWEVIPEDDKNPQQKKVAQQVETIIRRIPKFADLLKNCLWAIWKGTGVSEMGWEWDDRLRMYCITSHRPHDGDKITYDIDGNPRILTSRDHTAGRPLTQAEQERLIIHVFDPEDGAFFEGQEAAYLFKGRGLRDLSWQYWWLKHNALFFWLNFVERYGGGMVLGRYPMNNEPAKAAIESVLQNMTTDSRVSVPVPGSVDASKPGDYGVEVVTLGGQGKASSELFNDFVEKWAGKHIRMLIMGQEFGYEDSGDGLGSSRADRLQDTFRQFRDYDAKMLAQTLTASLVDRIVRFNYGELPFDLRFNFVLEVDDYEQAEKRVKAAKEMKLQIGKDWMYSVLGIPQPKEDDDIVDFEAQAKEEQASQMQGQPGGGRLAGLFADYKPRKRQHYKGDETSFAVGDDVRLKGKKRRWQVVAIGSDGMLLLIDEVGNQARHRPDEVVRISKDVVQESVKPGEVTSKSVEVDLKPSINVDVHMPAAETPEVKVDVQAPNVTVEAPDVKVENIVEPTPIHVDNTVEVNPKPPDVIVAPPNVNVQVEQPKDPKKKLKVRRDQDGNITGVDEA